MTSKPVAWANVRADGVIVGLSEARPDNWLNKPRPLVFGDTPEPNAVCGDCQGSGYGGHPDSGATCSTCHGSGGVYVDPVWQKLGAIDEADAIDRVMLLQAVATGKILLPVRNRQYAVTSINGNHIGLWSKREDAVAAMREYEGSSLTELVEVAS